MRIVAAFRAWLESLLRHGRADREMDEELRFHLDMETERQQRAGLSPEEARRRAVLALGGLERTRDAVRDARGSSWAEHLPQDLRQAARRLVRTPGHTAAAVLTLALGIGANTVIYSVVDGVLLRAVPFADARRLVVVWGTDRHSGTTREPVSWPDYLDLAARSRALDGAAAIAAVDLTLAPDEGDPLWVSGMSASAEFLRLVGVRPIAGRLFTADDDRPGIAPVAILGESIWRSRHAADPGVIGRTIRLNDIPHVVVGVVPHGADFGLDQIHARAAYHGPYNGAGEVDAWVPLQASEAAYPRATHPFFMLGRLSAGTSVAVAQTELANVAGELEREYPQANDGRSVHVEGLQEVVLGPTRPVMLLLLAAVTLVLLVACVNVANLLLARGRARAREVAVRKALGAGRRLGRQFLTEAVLLALLGGVAGVLLSLGGLRLLLALAPADIPRVAEVGLNLRVLLATLAVALGAGLAFGMVPTWQAFQVDVMATLRGESSAESGGPGARRFREGLVVAELALSVTLVVSAGLLIRSFWSVLEVDPGFRPEGVAKAEFRLPRSRYPADYREWPAWKEVHEFDQRLLDQVRAIPGVTEAAIANVHPLDAGYTNSFAIVGREAEGQDWPEISVRMVTPGYFATLGVSRLAGRDFSDGDDAAAAPVAVINHTAARRFFGPQDPLGHQIRFWGADRRIVGVVGDERIQGLTQAAPPAVYVPTGQAPRPGVVFARTAGDPADLVEPLRRAVLAVDPALAVFGAEPLSNTLRQSVGQRRFAMLVLGTFAALTFLLALVGIHGVLSYTTSQRTREIGIRLALGATGTGVTGLVLRGGLRLAALGTALGLAGAALGSRLLGSLLYGIAAIDPLTFGVVGLVAISAALLAIWLPARRAAGVAPITCLRAE